MAALPRIALEMRRIEKRFGATVALGGVDLEVLAGEVHALVGENGAGKSTLMKVLSGAVRQDAGEMLLDGEPYAPRGPVDARRRGVAMIYQELALAPHLSVAENVMLGAEDRHWGLVARSAEERRVREALEVLDHAEIAPRSPVCRLSISARQLVEVARALVGDARIIVLDEPTSSLTRADTPRLFRVIRRLKERGVSLIYISHFLEEVKEIADRFTVLRDGRTAASGVMAEATLESLIELMVGRPVAAMYPPRRRERGEAVLELNGLAGERLPRQASLTLHRGEILGVAGLIGAGRTEMMRAVFGLDPVRSGRVTVAGAGDITGCRPWHAIRSGLGLLSEDRKDEGLFANLSVRENIALSDYSVSRWRSVSRWGWISRRAESRSTSRWIDALTIKARSVEQAVAGLSGGNQQKVALARLLHQDADVLLLDEPTRGIDVGSKAQIYEVMGRLAAAGKAIIFVSSYVPELLGVADRVAVMSRGRLTSAHPAAALDEETILRLATIGEEGGSGGSLS
jgi:ribose transport system ATP-binding protein